MVTTRGQEGVLEGTLLDGLTLISTLLRVGHYAEAVNFAGQLLVKFPQALAVHLGLGRGLIGTGETPQRAIAHLRKVLDADPENWRVRLETVLLYLQGSDSQYERAGQELWLVSQTAPDNRWLRAMIDNLPDHSCFERTREWSELAGHLEQTGSRRRPKEDDEGGTARLFLKRKMPRMAMQYFDNALKKLPEGSTGRTDLKTGLLVALWQSEYYREASALASEMLLEQPQLILPRLLLISHLSNGALHQKPEALIHLTEPIWQLDPLLDRSFEMAANAGLTLPPELWPQLATGFRHTDEDFSPLRTPTNEAVSHPVQRWQKLGLNRTFSLRLNGLDEEWLESLLESSEKHGLETAPTKTRHENLREVSFLLADMEKLAERGDFNPIFEIPAFSGNLQKGQPNFSGPRTRSELDKIADSINAVENLLYGKNPPRRSSRPAPRRKPGMANRATPKGEVQEKHRPYQHNAVPAFDYSANALFSSQMDEYIPIGMQTATALVVTSEQALASKYGQEGYRQIRLLLDKIVRIMLQRGLDAKLLLVDSGDGLRENGFGQLSPVQAGQPGQVRNLINAALPGEDPTSRPPNIVFIIGGPDIIPFWKLPNPTFDSDREVLSDNPYGSRDSTYLLPERIVGRLPDDGGGRGDANLPFLLQRLNEVINRQQAELVTPKVLPPLPLRLVQSLLPNALRQTLNNLDDSGTFEQEWLQSQLERGNKESFLNSAQFSSFFYGAEAWKSSTETLREFMGGSSNSLYSPPTHAGTFDRSLFNPSRLLHFNLHGFRDTPNWYGQSQHSRLITSPTISSLPLAFTPALAEGVRAPGAVVFAEACYSGYLAGKNVEDSVALSLLSRGATAIVASTVISYGSAGPELSCASHLAYYFWKGALKQGFSFGQALKVAKTEYARERLAQGHNLTGDDVKTLLEFVLLGDPTVGIRTVSPSFVPLLPDMVEKVGNSNPEVFQKGGLGNFIKAIAPLLPEEELKLRGVVRGVWERFTRPKNNNYQQVDYNKLPTDLRNRVESILAWLLPDAIEPEGEILQALIDMGGSYSRDTFRPNQSFRQQKGGDLNDWLNDDSPTSSPPPNEGRLLLSGHRSLQTTDGLRFPQTFHLDSDFQGQQIKLNLSKGLG